MSEIYYITNSQKEKLLISEELWNLLFDSLLVRGAGKDFKYQVYDDVTWEIIKMSLSED